jgi:hypothetical protein
LRLAVVRQLRRRCPQVAGQVSDEAKDRDRHDARVFQGLDNLGRPSGRNGEGALGRVLHFLSSEGRGARVAGEDFLLVRRAPENMTKIEPLPSADGCYTVWFRVWSDSSGILVPGEIRSGMSQDEVRFYCLAISMAM